MSTPKIDVKKWGTIYLDHQRESTIDALDAMQSTVQHEKWSKNTEEHYMAKVREKAAERAKNILAEAYTERENIIAEARQEAKNIIVQAQAELEAANTTRIESQQELANAQQVTANAEEKLAQAQQEGYAAGIEQANAELAQFRASMGTSVAGLLGEIHSQCGVIFEGWRQEMAELLQTCVSQSVGIVLHQEHETILRTLVIETMRQLDDRRIITFKVHPDDEAAIADIIAAAKESIPDIGQWAVMGDPSIQPGGVIAEGQCGTVDNRLELHQQLVQDILHNLVLPASNLDAQATDAVTTCLQMETQRIYDVAGPPTPADPDTPEVDVTEAAPVENASDTVPPADMVADAAFATTSGVQTTPPQHMHDTQRQTDAVTNASLEDASDAFYTELPPDAAANIDMLQADVSGEIDTEETALSDDAIAALLAKAQNAVPDMTLDDSDGALTDIPDALFETAAPVEEIELKVKAEPTREELEEELLPLPPDAMDETLANGGFLDDVATDSGTGIPGEQR